MNRSTLLQLPSLFIYLFNSNRKICCTILLSYTLYTDYILSSIDKILMSYSFKKSQQEGATNSTFLLNVTFLFFCVNFSI